MRLVHATPRQARRCRRAVKQENLRARSDSAADATDHFHVRRKVEAYAAETAVIGECPQPLHGKRHDFFSTLLFDAPSHMRNDE